MDDDPLTAGRRLAVIAIGSNLGDRGVALSFARRRLDALLNGLVMSSPIETEPEGEGTAGQGPYLNAVAVGATWLSPRELLDALLAIEADFGRRRSILNASRTLDLDLILLGGDVVHEPGLDVPHPRFRDRLFVLGPLAEIAPDVVDPESGRTAVELLQRLLRDRRR